MPAVTRFRSRRTVLATLLAISIGLIGLTATRHSPASTGTVRLIDRLDEASDVLETIKGTSRRVLPPTVAKQAIPLDPAPPLPILRFSVGLLPGELDVTVRFRVAIRLADGSLKELYDRTVDTPGWYDEQLELAGFELAGAVLLLERNVVGKIPDGELARGFWGEPMLLPTVPTTRPSVVLVSIDTLRADRVGTYGSSGNHTPTLDEFAKTGVLYEQAYSPSTWTLPSHLSMLLGVPASRVPQRSKGMEDYNVDRDTALASVFRDAGYLTAGFTGGGYVSYRFGFAAGFDSYYSYVHPNSTENSCEPDRFDGPEVLRQTKRWLQENGNRPFFLFVHTYDAHDRCPLQQPGVRGGQKWNSSSKGRKRMSDYYDSVITKADGILGGVLAEIAILSTNRRIIVAVTSDHGEALWEHGFFGHGCRAKPYDPVVRVPLIVRPVSGGPAPGERVAAPVSVGSIAPTLLALAGLSKADSMVEPLLPGLGLDAPHQEAPIYASCGDQLAIRYGRYKLVTKKSEAGRDELYDLTKDPGEIRNLARKRPDLVSNLHQLAEAYWQTPSADTEPRSTPRPLDETTRQRLRALGYSE